MERENQTYVAYMLRLWQVSRDDTLVWWGSLENPHTGERHRFTDTESLFAFLRQQIDDPSAQAEQA